MGTTAAFDRRYDKPTHFRPSGWGRVKLKSEKNTKRIYVQEHMLHLYHFEGQTCIQK